MKGTSLKTIEVAEIHVKGRMGCLLSTAVREAAAFSLTEDCRVVLTFNEKQYVFEPEMLLKQVFGEQQDN